MSGVRSEAKNLGQPIVQEFSVRIPKKGRKKYNLFDFNSNQLECFTDWKSARIHRENNMLDLSKPGEGMPKFGAGSEFGREAREEARKRRYGKSKGYQAEGQPWILKATKKTGGDAKKFRGTRKGGVSENSAFYIFSHSTDGSIEAIPLTEWYKFQPIQRYKALSAEEAEEEFSRRSNIVNYFSVMLRKRLRNEDEADEETTKTVKTKVKDKDFKISEMDEWLDSDDDDEDSDDASDKDTKKRQSDEEDNFKKNKKKNKKKVKRKKKKNASDDEAFEESDDGDEEGKECDYISDSSMSESELEQQKEMKSVAEESGLRKLLASDDENDDDEDEDEEDNQDNKKVNKQDVKDQPKKETSTKEEKPKTNEEKNKQDNKSKAKESANSSTNSITDSSIDSINDQDKENENKIDDDTRKRFMNSIEDIHIPKKAKLDTSFNSPYIPGASESGITIDAVTRYLMRKPMTTIDLLKKFKSKKTGLTNQEIGHILMLVLTKINPNKTKSNGVTYYSLKS